VIAGQVNGREASDSLPPTLEEDIAIAQSYVDRVNAGDFEGAQAGAVKET
jgi:hypothetical protein